jgi:hypothetical protein
MAPVILFGSGLRMWVGSMGWRVYDLAKTFVPYIAVTVPAPNFLVADVFAIGICH